MARRGSAGSASDVAAGVGASHDARPRRFRPRLRRRHVFGEVACKYRDPVGPDWRVDETYARIRGRWHYIYRAIDELGQIVDAYVSPTRDMSLQDAPLFNLIIALAQILGYFSAAYLVDRL